MSAAFRLSKQKTTQNDLRRLMSEHKAKSSKEPSKRIDSPLAKYNETGQLMCILCKSIVRSEDVWKVHINAKQHKQNVEQAKLLKEKLQNASSTTQKASTARSASAAFKRPAPVTPSEVPAKVPRGILTNSTRTLPTSSVSSSSFATTSTLDTETSESNNALPADFFDAAPGKYFAATLKKTSIKTDLVNIKRGAENENENESMDVEKANDDPLPEGFFDDPIKDAKARHLDYKDPVEQEWEKFQHEIKEASNFSNAIIAEEQVEATSERQFEEIDEQMRNWSRYELKKTYFNGKYLYSFLRMFFRVLELEKKKEAVSTIYKSRERKKPAVKMETNESDEEVQDDGDEELDEFLDWRAKKAYK